MSDSSPPTDRPPAPSTPTEHEPRVLAALYRVSSIAGRIDDPAVAILRIIDELDAIFHSDSAVLALIDPDTGTLTIEHCRGYPAEHNRAAIPSGVGLMGWVALQHRAVVVGDVTYESRYIPLRTPTRSTMVAPIERDGQLHGIIALESDRTHAFSDADLKTLVLLTAEAGCVLQRLWQIKHLRQKASQLEALGNVALEVAGKLQFDELMETVVRESQRLAHCRVAVLQLYNASDRRVRLQAIFPPGDFFKGMPAEWPIEDSLAGSAITTRKQVEFANVRQPEFRDLADIPPDAQLVSVLSTPLLADKEVTGVLSIYTDRLHRFANDERRILKALANLAAVALQNARLYQRVFSSEESLRNSERLTTLGLLAAEIAHETRNPLTVIRLLFGALNLQFPDDDPRTTDVAIIREKLDQLESFVTRVLMFAKAPESLHTRWALDDIIRETCLLIRLKLNQARIHMHYEPPTRPVIVDCNKGQIQQVLLNIILNATHAMADGGSIAITCRVHDGAVQPTVAIDIIDTGHGIPPEFGDKIFDSFLSGREGGTGLGLSIAKRIMKSHHGDIEIAATGPSGTTMRLSLPVAS